MNRLILNIDKARGSLISIKANYFNGLHSHPIKRLAHIAPIMITDTPINFDPVKLAFMAPPEDGKLEKWNNLTYIDSLFSGYNMALSAWRHRYTTVQSFSDRVSALHSISLSIDDIRNLFNHGELSTLCDITERVITLTDDVLIGLTSLHQQVNKNAKSALSKKYLKKYCRALTISLPDNENASRILERSPRVDFNELSRIMASNPQELKARYRNSYD